MSNFQLDVFVLTYNRADYLMPMLDSIIRQTFQEFNLYVLDNCSSDNTPEVVEFYKKKYRINYIRHSENIGYTANMNMGFVLSKSKYFILLHDDDILCNNYLSEMVKLMELKPEVVMASCAMEGIDENGKTIIDDVYRLKSDIIYNKGEFIKDYCAGRNYIGCPTVIFRKDFFIRNNIIFRDDIGPATDTFLWFIVSDLGGIIYIKNQILFKYRYHAKQGSKINHVELLCDFYKNIKNYFSEQYEDEIELFRVRCSLLLRRDIFKFLIQQKIPWSQFLEYHSYLKKSGLKFFFLLDIIKFLSSKLLKKSN